MPNEIGLALRDVGASFSDLLQQQAARQQAAQQQQVALGQLGLRGLELQNQGRAQEAQAGVALAEVGAKARYQEAELAVQNRAADIAARQADIAALNQQSQADYSRRHAAVLEGTLTQNAPLVASHARLMGEQATAAGLATAAGSQPVYIDDFEKQLRGQLAAQGMPPDQVEERINEGKHTMDNLSSAANLPVDAAGRPYMTMAQAQARLKYHQDLANLNKRETLTAEQVAKNRLEYLKETKDDPGMLHLSYEEKGAIADALLLHNRDYYDATTRLLSPRIEAYRKEKIAELERRTNTNMFGTVTPATKEQIDKLEKDVITPQVYRWRAEIARGVLAQGGGKPVVAPPPGSGTPSPGGLPFPKTAPPGGAISTAWGGYPGAGAPSTPELHQAVIEGAIKRGLDPALALAQIQQESGFNPAAVGKSGEIGLGQFTQGTAKSRGLDLARLKTDPFYNLNASLDYMADLKQRHGGKNLKYVEGYNGLGASAGDSGYVANVQKWVPLAQQTVAALAKTPAPSSIPSGAGAAPAVPSPLAAPPRSLALETGGRPAGDFNAPPAPRPMPPLSRPVSPLDPLLTPLWSVPGWMEQARSLPAVIGERILQRGSQAPSLAAATQPQTSPVVQVPPSSTTVPLSALPITEPMPPPTRYAPEPVEPVIRPPFSLGQAVRPYPDEASRIRPTPSPSDPLLTGMPATALTPQDRATFEQVIARQYPQGTPDGVHRVLMGSTWFDVVIYEGRLQAVAPAAGG